jgi:hypothetical protein
VALADAQEEEHAESVAEADGETRALRVGDDDIDAERVIDARGVSVALERLLCEEVSEAVTLAVNVLERHDSDVFDGASDSDGDALTELERIGDRDIDGVGV